MQQFWLHHDRDSNHKEPALLQAPSLKHSAHGLQGFTWQSLDPDQSGESFRAGWKVCRVQ